MSAEIQQAARFLRELARERGIEAMRRVAAELDDEELRAIVSCWQFHAHAGQLRPATGEPIWLCMAGRGFGKTRTGAEETLDLSERWGPGYRGILVSTTIADVRDVMIEGESGLTACAERRGGKRLRYVANRGLVEMPHGGVAHVLSSEKPDKPRGYQSNHIWGDEIAKWNKPITVFDNLLLGWRLRPPVETDRPMMTLTTTPRPSAIMARLVREMRKRVAVTGGATSANKANLDPEFYETILDLYGGTKLGQQELEGILLDGKGAIVDMDTISKHRVKEAPELYRKVIAFDPDIDEDPTHDDAGIVVVGREYDRYAYVLEDCTQSGARAKDIADLIVDLYIRHDADAVVVELNQGNKWVVEMINGAADAREEGMSIPVVGVWATESKLSRAQPVGGAYEQGRVRHVGHFPHLEKEITTWMPGMDSPNRMDALVHGVTHLILGDELLERAKRARGTGSVADYFADEAA